MRLFRILIQTPLVLVLLVVVLVACVAANGWRLSRARDRAPAAALRVAADSTLRSRGEHLASVSCVSCHSSRSRDTLSGSGDDFMAETGLPFGHLWAPNLTPGGPLATWSDAEIARAIREGVDRHGDPLLVMPSQSFHSLSDRDVAALVTYLRRQPNVTRATPPRALLPLTYVVLGAHLFEFSRQPRMAGPVADPPHVPDARHGQYLVGLLDCRTCHGSDLHGGHKGQFPPLGPDIVTIASTHEWAAFDLAMRHGVSARDGHALDPSRMPFASFSRLDDTEAAAIYAYLRSLAPAARPRA